MSPSHLFIATAIFAVAVLAQQPTSVDDTSKHISINGSWNRLTNQDPNLARWGNTTTLSTTKGDIISWTFTGLAVEYWGGTGPDRGPCLIELDGERQDEVSGYAAADGPSRQLFRKSSLDPLRNHTITITVSSDKPPNVCDLDRFVYIPVPTTDTPQPNAQPTTDATRSTTHRKVPTVVMLLSTPQRTPVPFSPAKNPGPIIGGVIVGTIALLGLIASVFWIRRDRRKNAAMDAEEKKRKKLLVITCMEAKLNMELLLKASGFTGNPYMARYAGGRTLYATNEIIASQRAGVPCDIAVVHHIDCKYLTTGNDDASKQQPHGSTENEKVDALTPNEAVAQSVREDVRFLREHQQVRNETVVTGWILDAAGNVTSVS